MTGRRQGGVSSHEEESENRCVKSVMNSLGSTLRRTSPFKQQKRVLGTSKKKGSKVRTMVYSGSYPGRQGDDI